MVGDAPRLRFRPVDHQRLNEYRFRDVDRTRRVPPMPLAVRPPATSPLVAGRA